MSDEQQKHFNRVSYKGPTPVEPVIIANVSRYVHLSYSPNYWINEMSYFTANKIERLLPRDDNITTAQINFNDGKEYKMHLNMPFDEACQLVQDIKTGRHGNRPVDLREQTIFPESPALKKDEGKYYKEYAQQARKWTFK